MQTEHNIDDHFDRFGVYIEVFAPGNTPVSEGLIVGSSLFKQGQEIMAIRHRRENVQCFFSALLPASLDKAKRRKRQVFGI